MTTLKLFDADQSGIGTITKTEIKTLEAEVVPQLFSYVTHDGKLYKVVALVYSLDMTLVEVYLDDVTRLGISFRHK